LRTVSYLKRPSFAIFALTCVLIDSPKQVAAEECDRNFSTAQHSICAQKDVEQATKEMNTELTRALSAAKEMLGPITHVDFRPQILRSQELWDQWKESQCNLEADVTMGSDGAFILPECRQRLTIKRTHELSSIAVQLEGFQ